MDIRCSKCEGQLFFVAVETITTESPIVNGRIVEKDAEETELKHVNDFVMCRDCNSEYTYDFDDDYTIINIKPI